MELVDGRILKSGELAALGDPDNPLGSEGLENKFRWLAGYILDRDRVEAILEKVLSLENEKDITALLKLL